MSQETGNSVAPAVAAEGPVGAQFDALEAAPHPPELYRHDGLAPTRAGLAAILDAEIAAYREQGFLAVEGVFGPEAVAAALAGLTDLIMSGGDDASAAVAGDAPRSGLDTVEDPHPSPLPQKGEGARKPYPGPFPGVQFESWARGRLAEMGIEAREAAVRKLMWFVNWEPRLGRLARDPALLEAVRRLMGGREPKLFQDMALLKPPGGREKPWHQDHAYFNYPLGTPIVGVWIALDEATVASGCMRLRPGTHRDGPMVHFDRRDFQICDTAGRARRVLAAPLRPGGALLFDGLLQHGTPANPTARRRRAVQFHFAPADVPATGTKERLAIFGSEGKGAEC